MQFNLASFRDCQWSVTPTRLRYPAARLRRLSQSEAAGRTGPVTSHESAGPAVTVYGERVRGPARGAWHESESTVTALSQWTPLSQSDSQAVPNPKFNLKSSSSWLCSSL